jgi:hypothetical protein
MDLIYRKSSVVHLNFEDVSVGPGHVVRQRVYQYLALSFAYLHIREAILLLFRTALSFFSLATFIRLSLGNFFFNLFGFFVLVIPFNIRLLRTLL